MAEGGKPQNIFNVHVESGGTFVAGDYVGEKSEINVFQGTDAENNQGVTGDGVVSQPESNRHKTAQENKVTGPKINNRDLTWLVTGKFALFKKRPLSKPSKTVFYGMQQVLPEYWREVAIKVIHYEKKNICELQLLMKLRHPNIVQLIDAIEKSGDTADYIYIVMELCSQNLRTYVENNPFDFRKSLSFVHQIVEGLAYLHSNNVTHRDLKPDNVLISPCKKVIKLADFGLSKEIPEGKSKATVTTIGAGTEGYRAPETYQNTSHVSTSIDIFAFGLVTYFTFSNGKHPYGPDPYKWSSNIKENQNLDLTQVIQFRQPHAHKREQLIHLLGQTLQHEPGDRPTVMEIRQAAFVSGIVVDEKDASQLLEAVKISRTTQDSDANTNEKTTKNSMEPAKNNEEPKSIFASLKNFFRADSSVQKRESDNRDIKRTQRIQEITDNLKKPLKKTTAFRNSQLLLELRKLQGSDDLDILLQMAECELYLQRGREDESIQRTRDFISTSRMNSADVRKMASDIRKQKYYLRALILNRISYDLPESQNASPDDEVQWISRVIFSMSSNVRGLIKGDDRSRDIGIKYGLEYMEETLLNDLRKLTTVSPDVRTLKEADFLNDIIVISSRVGQYQKSTRLGHDAIALLENHFGDNASNYRRYSSLLHNLGSAYRKSGLYSDAERYYVKALEAEVKVLDYKNESEKFEKIELTEGRLVRTRKLLGKRK